MSKHNEDKAKIDAEVRKTLSAVDGVPRATAAPDFSARLQARLRDGEARNPVGVRSSLANGWLRPVMVPLMLGLGVAAGILLGSQYENLARTGAAESLATTYELAPPDVEAYVLTNQVEE